MKKQCQICGKSYETPRKESKYCERACYAEARKRGLYGKVEWTDEMRRKMSERYTGEGNPMYGLKGFWAGKVRDNMLGEKHFNYKGGWKQAGYHFVCKLGRQRSMQRELMSKHLGRELLPNEVVHHINGDKLDNKIENLKVVTRAEHINIHRKELLISKKLRKVTNESKKTKDR